MTTPIPNFSEMSTEEFATWKLYGATPVTVFASGARRMTETITANIGENEEPPRAAAEADPYAPLTWGRSEYDFRTPTGQLCRLRVLQPEMLIKEGILDKVSRLSGITEDLIKQSSGGPPAKVPAEDAMPSAEELDAVISVLDILLPIAVVRPYISPIPPEGEERKADRIYPDSIDLVDRIAIMEKALEGVSKLDNFRKRP